MYLSLKLTDDYDKVAHSINAAVVGCWK